MRLRLRAAARARMAAWIRRRQGPDSLPLVLTRRRLYILPTRAGVAFGLLWFMMLLAGLNYGNSLALFLTFLLAGFALVAMHECHRNLLGTTLMSVSAPPVFAGRPGSVQLTLDNPGSAPRPGIQASLDDGPLVTVELGAHGRGRLELPLAAARRGVVSVASRSSRTFPSMHPRSDAARSCSTHQSRAR